MKLVIQILRSNNWSWSKSLVNPVADPGFPRGEGANPPRGAPTYDFAKFSQKLHEIERIWTPRGRGECVPRERLDPPVKSMPFRWFWVTLIFWPNFGPWVENQSFSKSLRNHVEMHLRWFWAILMFLPMASKLGHWLVGSWCVKKSPELYSSFEIFKTQRFSPRLPVNLKIQKM